jgi:hypothetical protein
VDVRMCSFDDHDFLYNNFVFCNENFDLVFFINIATTNKHEMRKKEKKHIFEEKQIFVSVDV